MDQQTNIFTNYLTLYKLSSFSLFGYRIRLIFGVEFHLVLESKHMPANTRFFFLAKGRTEICQIANPFVIFNQTKTEKLTTEI